MKIKLFIIVSISIHYRIFRGYVVRNQYKYLRREVRERLEDERKAQVERQQ